MASGITLEMSMEEAGPAPGDELVERASTATVRTIPRQASEGIRDSQASGVNTTGLGSPDANSLRKGAPAPPGAVQPGAHAAMGRPVGGLPAWHARNRQRRSGARPRRNRSSQSHLPPEMRTRNSSGASRIRQSIMSVFGAGPSVEGSGLQSGEQRTSTAGQRTSDSSGPRRSRRSRRSRGGRRSSIMGRISLMFAGDAVVQTPEQIEEEQDEKRFRKEVWGVVACLVVVLVISVAVGVGLALSGDGGEPVSNPTPAPTPQILTDRAEILKTALKGFSSDPGVFDDRGGYQFRALTWLADLDEAAIDPEDSSRLETRYALAAIYFATNGNGWLEDLGFLSSAHECDWSEFGVAGNATEPEPMQAGVYCNSNKEVLSLNLDSNNLVGFIPEEMKALTSLRHLSLKSNKFSGNRPALDAVETGRSISQMEGSLISLDVSSNAWDAVIPSSFGQLTNLEILNLADNELKFTIPVEFSNLSNLRELYLDGNERMVGLASGGLEDIVINMPGLEILSAARAGNLRISPELRFPTSLTLLNLERCDIGSALTANVGRLSNLQTLGLRGTSLVGAIPTEFGLMTGLANVDLSDNSLAGLIPWSNLNPAILTQLYLEKNQRLQGSLPSDIGIFTALEYLDIDSNFLGGDIPESIGDMTSLVVLDISVNRFTGPIPSAVGNLVNLKQLRLDWNQMTGTLPSEMSNMESLEYVALSGNEITGGDLEFICSRTDSGGPIPYYQNLTCSCCELIF